MSQKREDEEETAALLARAECEWASVTLGDVLKFNPGAVPVLRGSSVTPAALRALGINTYVAKAKAGEEP